MCFFCYLCLVNANIRSLGFSRKAKISRGCANDGERRPPNRWATSMLGRSRVRVPNRFRRNTYSMGTSPTQRKAGATLSILLPVLYSAAKVSSLGFLPRSQAALYPIFTASLTLKPLIRHPFSFIHHNLILGLMRIHILYLLQIHRSHRETHSNTRCILAASRGVRPQSRRLVHYAALIKTSHKMPMSCPSKYLMRKWSTPATLQVIAEMEANASVSHSQEKPLALPYRYHRHMSMSPLAMTSVCRATLSLWEVPPVCSASHRQTRKMRHTTTHALYQTMQASIRLCLILASHLQLPRATSACDIGSLLVLLHI